MSALVLRRAEVDGVVVDVRLDGGTVSAVGPPGAVGGADRTIDCDGGALLPGLHDHHLHLMAMAAALDSVDVSHDFEATLMGAHARADSGAWLRAVGYDEVEGGPLDRDRLDALAPGRPVRVQHRSGALWVLSSTALDRVGAAGSAEDGVERDATGRPTGRLFRLDGWIGERLGDRAVPDLAAIGRRLSSFGVTGVTDCTPTTSLDHLERLARAVRDGALPLTVAVTGGPELAEADRPAGLQCGPVKVVLADHALPELAQVATWIRQAHRVPRPVAIHCVTRVTLALALAAWHEVGSIAGDRVEHASVTAPAAAAALADLGITVVTQPAFVAARGHAYLRDVESEDRADLYRCASLLAAGVAIGGSTDAPFGADDPWLAIRSATDRRSACGRVVGDDAPLEPGAALALFLAPLARPGGPARAVRVGAPADFCLLDAPLGRVLQDPDSRHVAMTLVGGAVRFSR